METLFFALKPLAKLLAHDYQLIAVSKQKLAAIPSHSATLKI